MATVGLPLTGAGDATAQVAVDLIGGAAYQRIKIHDGMDGSTTPVRVLGTTPASSDEGMVVRSIGSTAFNQAVVGAVGLTSGSSQVGITSGSSAVELTSAGSTRLAGRFTVDNPTTAVGITSGSSAVELTSAGSTRLAGRFDVNNPTTAVSLSSQLTITVGNPTTAVTVSSGLILGAGSSANMLGQVYATGTTKVDVSSGVILGAGSSANMLGQVQATGTTKVDVSSGVILGAGSSANMLGQVQATGTTAVTITGSSGVPIYFNTYPFSSGNVARTSVATSVDVQLIAANNLRRALILANGSTAQTVLIGLTTGTVTTGLANLSMYLAPADQITFGLPSGMPNYLGPIRAINVASTALAGYVVVSEFTS